MRLRQLIQRVNIVAGRRWNVDNGPLKQGPLVPRAVLAVYAVHKEIPNRMPQVYVTRRYRFCAAHRLHTDHLSPEENWAAFGKCNNPNGHGHNYIVLVTITSEAGEEVCLNRLDQVANERIVDRFDHRDLNGDPAFAALTTTGENIVKLIWDILEPQLTPGRLHKVGVIETRDNYFEYAGVASNDKGTE